MQDAHPPACTAQDTSSAIHELFVRYSEELEEETQQRDVIRDVVKEIDRKQRLLLSVLHKIHQLGADVQMIGSRVSHECLEFAPLFLRLQQSIPDNLVHKFSDLWKWQLTQLMLISILARWLVDGSLISPEQAAASIGLPEKIPLELDVYLLGVCSIPNELSRLCINSVTSGHYERVQKISEFTTNLHGAFGLLNLKNDSLRKKFDSIKWDLKKIEEVTYDINIRNLTKQS